MARYKAGDVVFVNGIKMTLGSWPADDQGPFFATYTNSQGGEVQGTYWAGQVADQGEPIHTSDTVAFVAEGAPVESTAGEVPPVGEADAGTPSEESVQQVAAAIEGAPVEGEEADAG